VAFELVYVVMLAMVLAVIAAASGSLAQEYLHLPRASGIATLLLTVVLFAFHGRNWVTRILAYKALILCAVFLVYFLLVVHQSSDRIIAQFMNREIVPGWATGAMRYSLYASVVIPTMLFATVAIETRRQAFASGTASAIAGILPAVLLHVSFGAGYPEVVTQAIPTYWMIASLKMPVLTVAYIVVLFGSLFDVGIGFIQSVNERVDGWSMEHRGRKVDRQTRAGIAFLCVLASGGLSLVGIVPLIAQGYSTMAYAFLLLFVGPLLSKGVYRLACAPRAARTPQDASLVPPNLDT